MNNIGVFPVGVKLSASQRHALLHQMTTTQQRLIALSEDSSGKKDNPKDDQRHNKNHGKKNADNLPRAQALNH